MKFFERRTSHNRNNCEGTCQNVECEALGLSLRYGNKSHIETSSGRFRLECAFAKRCMMETNNRIKSTFTTLGGRRRGYTMQEERRRRSREEFDALLPGRSGGPSTFHAGACSCVERITKMTAPKTIFKLY